MTPRTLKLLVLLVAGLIAIRIVVSLSEAPPATAPTDIGLVSLASEDWTADRVAAVRAWRGTIKAGEAPALLLVRRGSGWAIASHFDAPARGQGVDELLKLVGEARAELRGESAAAHADFGLLDEEALHLEFRDGKDQTLVHWLLGKNADGYDKQFVRRAGEHKVYQLSAHVGQKLGAWNETAPVSHNVFLERSCFKVEADKLARIEIVTPDRTTVLEYAEKPPEAPPAEGQPAAPPTKAWRLAQPGLPWPLKDNALDDYARALSAIECADVLDPAREGGWGLGDASVTLTYTREGGQVDRLVLGTVDPKESDAFRAMQVNGAGPVFKLPSWTLAQLLRPVKRFATARPVFPDLASQAEAQGRLVIHMNGRELAFEGKGEDWRFLPRADWAARGPTIKGVIQKLLALESDDLADRRTLPDPGLADPAQAFARVDLKLGDKQATLTIGGTSRALPTARYFDVTGGLKALEPWTYVLAVAEHDQLAPPIDRLVALPAPAFKVDEAVELELSRGETRESFRRDQPDGPWKTADPAMRELVPGGLERVLQTLRELKWQDWFPAAGQADGSGGRVRLRDAQGRQTVLELGGDVSGRVDLIYVHPAGGPDVFAIARDAQRSLFPGPGMLSRERPEFGPAPPPEQPAPPAEVKTP